MANPAKVSRKHFDLCAKNARGEKMRRRKNWRRGRLEEEELEGGGGGGGRGKGKGGRMRKGSWGGKVLEKFSEIVCWAAKFKTRLK